jgi:hypothetical protein
MAYGYLRRYNGEVTDRPYRKPYFAPRVFNFFGYRQKHVVGKRFAVDVNVKQGFTS